MDLVRLPGTELSVSRVTVGCEALGGTDWGDSDVDAVVRAIHVALDAGINVFDVADVYSLGVAEERLAASLGERRKDVVIVTKFGVGWTVGPAAGRAITHSDASPARLMTALDASLRRLRIDCIPVYLVHRPDPRTPLADTLEALDRCKAAGKIRSYGLSNFSIDAIRGLGESSPVSVLENEYSLVNRSAEPLLTLARAKGCGVFTYGTLAHGLLTGKYSADTRFPENDRRHRMEVFSPAGWDRHRSVVQAVVLLAARHQRSPSEIAIAWALSNPAVSSAIVGVKSEDQVRSATRATEHALSDDDYDMLTAGAYQRITPC